MSFSAPSASTVNLFFGLGDGGALAFFQFANPSDQEQFGPKMPFTPFHHIALNVDRKTQAGIEKRLKERDPIGSAQSLERTSAISMSILRWRRKREMAGPNGATLREAVTETVAR